MPSFKYAITEEQYERILESLNQIRDQIELNPRNTDEIKESCHEIDDLLFEIEHFQTINSIRNKAGYRLVKDSQTDTDKGN
jgi:prefoldin subunit 5